MLRGSSLTLCTVAYRVLKSNRCIQRLCVLYVQVNGMYECAMHPIIHNAIHTCITRTDLVIRRKGFHKRGKKFTCVGLKLGTYSARAEEFVLVLGVARIRTKLVLTSGQDISYFTELLAFPH